MQQKIAERDPNLVTFILNSQKNILFCQELPELKIKKLGQGEYGTVFSALLHNKPVAIKEEILETQPKCVLKDEVYQCNSYDSSVVPELIVSYWIKMHPDPVQKYNIAQIESYFSCFSEKTQQTSVFLVMDLYDGTLKTEWKRFDQQEKFNIALQLYYTILYFERIGLHYIDMHPQNILIEKVKEPITITYQEGILADVHFLSRFSDFGISEIDGLLTRIIPDDVDGNYRPDFDKMIRMLFYLENGALEEPSRNSNFPTLFGRKISRFVYDFEQNKVSKKDFQTTMYQLF